jgi:AhpD family alkylhydroperoxidase
MKVDHSLDPLLSYDPLVTTTSFHTFESRLAISRAARDVYRAMDAFDSSIDFDPRLRELVRIRVAQLNGCAYCLDLHTRDARAAGEDQRRIDTLAGWHESVFFTDRERAAFALTDAVTRLGEHGVSDDVWAEAAAFFDEGDLAQLLWSIVAINAWTRIGVATRMVPES